ncbi:MAG TPA: NAD(P)H-binding protein [Solirubrobacteraceae bacterium]|nr:NAD(P)H-binding protein [Solirubrobacteraceae bacterium]
MVVAIAGAHGKIATRLTALLVAGGDSVIGLVRNPDHAPDVSRQGGAPVVCDLEHATVDEVSAAIAGADARRVRLGPMTPAPVACGSTPRRPMVGCPATMSPPSCITL